MPAQKLVQNFSSLSLSSGSAVRLIPLDRCCYWNADWVWYLNGLVKVNETQFQASQEPVSGQKIKNHSCLENEARRLRRRGRMGMFTLEAAKLSFFCPLSLFMRRKQPKSSYIGNDGEMRMHKIWRVQMATHLFPEPKWKTSFLFEEIFCSVPSLGKRENPGENIPQTSSPWKLRLTN